MDDFTQRYDLKYNNAFVFRGYISQIEYGSILQEMCEIIASNKLKVDGYVTTSSHGFNDDEKVDMEIIIPLNSSMKLNDDQKTKFSFIETISIENCLKVRQEGNPQLINEKIEYMLKYISDNKLEALSDIYTVVIKDVMSMDDINNGIVEAYVQVSS